MAIDGIGAGFSVASPPVRVGREDSELQAAQKADEIIAEQEAGSAADVASKPLSFAALATNVITPSDFDVVVEGEGEERSSTIASISEKVEDRVRNSFTNSVIAEDGAGTLDGSAARVLNESARVTSVATSVRTNGLQGSVIRAVSLGGNIDIKV